MNRSRLQSALQGICLIPAGVFIATFLGVALARLSYPFELEWMEGGSLVQALRLAQGLPLYPAPSLEFTPFLYPPLYYALCAQLDALGLLSLPGMRAISLAASLSILLLLWHWVWRETRNIPAALVAAGAYAASFAQSGFFFDLARVDSLWMALMLGFAYALRFSNSGWGHLFAAGLATAAFFTKQQSVALIAALAVAACLRNRKQGFLFAASTVVFLATGILLLQQRTEGWFGYYAFLLPSNHAWEREAITGFWFRDLGISQLLPFLALALLTLRPWLSSSPGSNGFSRPTANARSDSFFYPLLFSALFAMAWMSRLHTGGYLNVLMPAHASLALAGGLLWPWWFSWIFHGEGRVGFRAWVGLPLIFACWFSWVYNPLAQTPSQSDREAGNGLVERLRQESGEVWIPNHPYLAHKAGKRPWAHRMALEDALRVKHPAGDALRAEIRRAVAENSFSVLYLSASDPREEAVLPEEFLSHYSLQDSVFQGERLFRPRAGMKLRPQYRFIPRLPAL